MLHGLGVAEARGEVQLVAVGVVEVQVEVGGFAVEGDGGAVGPAGADVGDEPVVLAVCHDGVVNAGLDEACVRQLVVLLEVVVLADRLACGVALAVRVLAVDEVVAVVVQEVVADLLEHAAGRVELQGQIVAVAAVLGEHVDMQEGRSVIPEVEVDHLVVGGRVGQLQAAAVGIHQLHVDVAIVVQEVGLHVQGSTVAGREDVPVVVAVLGDQLGELAVGRDPPGLLPGVVVLHQVVRALAGRILEAVRVVAVDDIVQVVVLSVVADLGAPQGPGSVVVDLLAFEEEDPQEVPALVQVGHPDLLEGVHAGGAADHIAFGVVELHVQVGVETAVELGPHEEVAEIADVDGVPVLVAHAYGGIRFPYRDLGQVGLLHGVVLLVVVVRAGEGALAVLA